MAKRKIAETSILNKKRLVMAFVIFGVLLFLLCIRVGYVQVVKGNEYGKMAVEQQTKDEVIKPERGKILDRNGGELAVSQEGYSVWVRPGELAWGDTKTEQEENKEESLKELSKIIGEDDNELIKTVNDSKKTLLKVKNFIDKETADKIRKKKAEKGTHLAGVSLSEEVKRYYPMGTFLAHTLGSVTDDNQGLSGIELEYNKYLAGVDGRWVKNTDVGGNTLAYGTEKYYEPQDGADVTLTIDQVIQNYVEQSIKESHKKYKAKRVSCMVMETKTGEILAMASTPGFDPNNSRVPSGKKDKKKFEKMSSKEQMDYLNEMWRNPLVSDVFEPGSTAKLVNAAACLEEGIVSKNDTFYCKGYLTVNGIKVNCWSHEEPHGTQTFYEGVENSCNPVFMNLAMKLGKEKYYDYINLFGLTEKTGIDFPGEASSIIKNEKEATKLDLAIMGMGQVNATTPIQIITALSSFGNDGKIMEPHLVKKVTDNDGKTVEEIKPKVVRRAVSKSTADEICVIMRSVVKNGGGNKADIPGYRVGGKTGTAEAISEKGGYSGEVIASFVGMAPMDDPDVSITYIIDSPEGEQYGGTVAAPATKELLEKILKYRDVKPKYTKEDKKEIKAQTIKVPSVKGKKSSEAKAILKGYGLKYKISPETSSKKEFIVKDQYPAAGSKTNKNGIVYLYRE